jgi:nicotinamide riboside transporter PnuC
MIAWILWFIYALIPAAITIVADLSMQTMTILYFAFIFVAVVAMGIWEKARKKSPDEV